MLRTSLEVAQEFLDGEHCSFTYGYMGSFFYLHETRDLVGSDGRECVQDRPPYYLSESDGFCVPW